MPVGLRTYPIPRWLGLFMIVFGSFFAWIAWDGARMRDASQHWPTVDGRIEESSVRSERSTGSDALELNYFSSVRYRYSVNGVDFVGTRAQFVEKGSRSSAEATEWVLQNPAGKTLPVHYDPQKPAESVLYPTAGAHPRMFVWIGGGTFLPGVLVLLWPRRR